MGTKRRSGAQPSYPVNPPASESELPSMEEHAAMMMLILTGLEIAVEKLAQLTPNQSAQAWMDEIMAQATQRLSDRTAAIEAELESEL